MKYRSSATTKSICLAKASLVLLPFSAIVLAQGNEFDQLGNVANASTIETVMPNRSDMRIPERVQGRVVVRATRPLPINVDDQFVPPAEDITTRRFSLDSIGLAERSDMNESNLLEVMSEWLGKELSFAEFQLAALTLLEYLQTHGHPNASLQFSQMQFREGKRVAVAIEGLTPEDFYDDGQPRIMVAGFKVNGVTVLDQAKVASHMQGWSGRELTLEELGEAAESLAELIRNAGYGLAQAWLPPQDITDGVVEISVLEGIVDGLSGDQGITIVNEGRRTRADRLQPFLAAAIEPDQPLNVEKLERSLRLLNEHPGIKRVQTDLSPGSQPGTTQVIATIEESNLYDASIALDNYGSIYSGQERVNLAFNLNSPLGYGEQYFTNIITAEEMDSFKVGGHLPIGNQGFRVGLSHARMNVDIGQELAFLSLSSRSETTSLFANYPLVRRIDQNIDLSAALEQKRYRNQSPEFMGAFDNDRLITAGTLSASGNWIDRFRGQSAWSMSLQLADLDLSGNQNYQQTDSTTANTEGAFNKVNWSLSRLQSLPYPDWYLFAGLSGQYANKNLDSSEKFQLGGPMGVRAYPVGEAVGDHGVLANLEIRKRLGSYNQIDAEWFAFYDIGSITQYAKPWAGALPDRPNTYRLAGYGTGLSVSYGDNGSVRLTYAQKAGNNPNPTPEGTDSDGRTDSGRVWLIGTLLF